MMMICTYKRRKRFRTFTFSIFSQNILYIMKLDILHLHLDIHLDIIKSVAYLASFVLYFRI